MRTKKAIRNAAFSILYQLVAVICGLITPRLILGAFGSTYNGVISSAQQFLEMISFLTLGIAGATRVALYKPIARNDTFAISRIVKSNKRYMHKVGLAVIAYAVVLSLIYPYISHNNLSPWESSALIAIISIGSFAQYFFGATNQALLSADQSGYINYIIQTLATVCNTFIAVILIKLGGSIFVVKLGSAIVFLLSPIVLNLVVKRKYGLVNDCEPDDTALQQRGAVAFHSIANIVHEDTDLIVLTIFTDAKLISVYTIYQLIVGKVRRILLMLTNGLEGAFGNIWAKQEIRAFERNFRFFEFLIFAFTSIVFCCVAVLIIPFVRLYTSGVHDVNYIRVNFALLTVLTETMYCIRHPYLIIVQATGNYEGTKMGAMYEALINIGLSLVLVNFIGLSGVMLGTLVANTFRTVQYALFISKNVIVGTIKGTVRRFVWFVANSAITVVLQIVVMQMLPSVIGWMNWIVDGCCAMVISAIVTSLMAYLFYREEFLRLCTMGKAVLRRGKKTSKEIEE